MRLQRQCLRLHLRPARRMIIHVSRLVLSTERLKVVRIAHSLRVCIIVWIHSDELTAEHPVHLERDGCERFLVGAHDRYLP